MKLKLSAIFLTLSLSSSVLAENIENQLVQMGDSSVKATATANPVGGYVNTTIYTSSHHTVDITNITDKDQNYSIHFYLCPDSKSCATSYKQVTLPPSQSFHWEGNLSQPVSYGSAGHYGVEAKTEVDYYTQTIVKGSNTITVYAK